jgi:hypothetical protein
VNNDSFKSSPVFAFAYGLFSMNHIFLLEQVGVLLLTIASTVNTYFGIFVLPDSSVFRHGASSEVSHYLSTGD